METGARAKARVGYVLAYAASSFGKPQPVGDRRPGEGPDWERFANPPPHPYSPYDVPP